jgi:hypothetical protein
VSSHAGRTKTGQARSAEVLARRKAASPRGASEWGGKSMAFIHKGQKEVRRDLGRAAPGSEKAAIAMGTHKATVSIRDIVGKHLGLTPGQLAFKDRRHERVVAKHLRRMLRDVRTARSNGRAFHDAFPGNLHGGYRELEAALTGEIDAIKGRGTR